MLLHRFGLEDGLPVHFSAGAFAGLMATVLGAPVDVVKTRIMASKKAVATLAPGVAPAIQAGEAVYTGAIDCVIKTLRNEGPLAFYKGCVPLFIRITGW